jgi:site-specific DNA-cytosine methylase
MYFALKAKQVKWGLFENVVEASSKWGDYQDWKAKIEVLGYGYQEVHLNARHLSVAPSRDHYMGVVWHKDLPGS